MDDLGFNWLSSEYTPDYATPELPIFSSPTGSPSVALSDPPSGERALPLLRLSSWERDGQYDKNNPECIHYDFRWKVSQRDNIRARHIVSDTDTDLVLAPSDYWKEYFQPQLERLLQDEDKFPGDAYTCEETIISISAERKRQHGLKTRCDKLEIDWNKVDGHMEGLGTLFSQGRKITLCMDFVYKEVTKDPKTAKGKQKRKSATDAQKARLAAEAGLWTRVYKHYRCRAKHCKQGPHCWVDPEGNHHRLFPGHLEEVHDHIKANMMDGQKVEQVDVNVEIPSKVRQALLAIRQKRKADSDVDCRPCKHRGGQCNALGTAFDGDHGVPGDREAILVEYCNWTLQQVKSDRWREGLQTANKFALDQLLELNSILQYPKAASDLMVTGGVKPGVALQFVGNVTQFLQERKKQQSTS